MLFDYINDILFVNTSHYCYYRRIVANNSEICSKIGFQEKAVLNSCGFCTEGDTGLDPNYGFDCNNLCNGESYLDCNNQCNGNSFIDVCTGICISESIPLLTYFLKGFPQIVSFFLVSTTFYFICFSLKLMNYFKI